MYRLDSISNIKNMPLKNESYMFELPTRVTKLEPVFFFSFDIDKKESKKILNVALNPKLSKQSGNTNLVKKFYFDSDNYYRFNNEEFSNYFIEGEIRLLNLNPKFNDKSCFVSITYGNRDEALHFIKGKFKLNEKVEFNKKIIN